MERGKWRLEFILRFPISNASTRLSTSLQSPISIFLRDRRGVSLVTYTLVLPLLLIIIFGAATVWRVISVKQSMDVVTYEAARYLSREGRRIAARALPYYNADEWTRIAHDEIDDWVRRQIGRNPFVNEPENIQIKIVPPFDVECNPWGAFIENDSRNPDNIRFTVTTKLSLESLIKIPYIDIEPPLAFALEESHSDLVECPRFFGRPPDEGEIFFPRTRR